MITAFLLSVAHVSTSLPMLMPKYGVFIYLVLFLVIFCETGLVITPFLPGDSIIFICGSLAALDNSLNIFVLLLMFTIAATVGDFINFEIGKHFRQRLATRNKTYKIFTQKNFQRSQQFFDKHGNIAVFLGRFIPIIRTMIPFTAGMSQMKAKSFAKFNIIGGLCWVILVSLSGFFLGTIPIIKAHFEIIIVGIALISALPVALSILKQRRKPVA